MDEACFVYSEEADWCYRFSRAGWRRVFTPCARIVHPDGVGPRALRKPARKCFVQKQKNSMIYHRRNFGLAAWWSAKMIYIGSNFVRTGSWSQRRTDAEQLHHA
jgi:GT2 family glycosyltransferase